jgi:hypothetical protein
VRTELAAWTSKNLGVGVVHLSMKQKKYRNHFLEVLEIEERLYKCAKPATILLSFLS